TKKYVFKCHCQTIDNMDYVWPINALAFQSTYNTFASGGSDATVSSGGSSVPMLHIPHCHAHLFHGWHAPHDRRELYLGRG
ncbi:hypothetical protein EDB86DRAFT_2810629, partial [Lactarius hatsudake]